MFKKAFVKDVHVMVEDDQELISTTRRKYKEDMKPFSRVGPIKHKNSPAGDEDWVDILLDLSKATSMLFKEVKKKRCKESNIVIMSEWDSLDNDVRRPINHKLAELKKAGLVLKVKPIMGLTPKITKNTFMINPYTIKPNKYNNACLLWKTLGGKEL